MYTYLQKYFHIDVVNYTNKTIFLIFLYSKHFPSPKYPHLDSLRRNVSLALVNYHFTTGYPRPNLPALIEVGGLQVKDPPSPLPKDLQTWLDEAEYGAIYMSMGSNVKSTSLSAKSLDAIVHTFSKLKQRIIWKFENDSLPGLSKNVMVSKWLPQDDLLAHKNLKIFITHGGLGSIIEAKYHGVPLVGIPIFADQLSNLINAERSGVAKIVQYTNLTRTTFSEAINDVLNDPIYRQTAKQISELFRDRPAKPMETAVFWTEYVLRHHGAPHLLSNSVYLNFWQLHSFDVIGFIILILVSTLFIVFTILKFVIRKLFGFETKAKSQNKKTQ